MNIAATLQHYRHIRQEHGMRAMVTALRDRYAEWYYERHFGIDTRAVVSRAILGYEDPTWKEYVATNYRALFAMLRRYVSHPSGTFIDYGCGQGRALAVAATFPFDRVIGVELHPDLAAKARANLGRARSRLKCRQVEVVQSGAEAFAVPDDVTVAYFFNPFSGPALLGTLAQLGASVARRPRTLRLICGLPDRSGFENTLSDAPDLLLVARDRWSPGIEFVILDFNAPDGNSSLGVATAQKAKP
jgi:SAM-dependent methyltransferase